MPRTPRRAADGRPRRRRARFGHRSAAWGLAAAAVLGVLLGAGAGRAAPPLDITGTWFVLVHYTDASTANPEATRWLDLVWQFSRKGSRLEWVEYPIVVFEDTSGRFESRDGNPRARVLAAWEPNGAQRETIAAGPRVNPRGVRVKTLRGSDADGWKSVSRSSLSASPLTIGYQQNLRIEGLDALPLFSRMDVVGNALHDSGESGSTYRVEAVRDEGAILVGHYTRDGIREGTFRMWRTPPVRGLAEREGTPNDRARQRAVDAYEESRSETPEP
jgi:hypothetical protein